MEQKNNSIEVLNIVRSIVYHLNDVTLNKMTQKILALPITNIKLLEDVTNMIFNRALNRQNYTHIYAQMCARMIKDSNFNNITTDTKTTFKKVLLKKCHDVFNTLINNQQELQILKNKMKNSNKELEKFTTTLNHYQFEFNKKVINNCRFIGELFRSGAFPEKIIWSCITDLGKGNDELQMHCLCVLLQLAGPIISKKYDLNKTVKKLLLSLDNNVTSPTLKRLIMKVQRMNSKGWRNEETVKREEKNYINFIELPTEIKSMYELKSNKTISGWIFDECNDILFDFVHKTIDEVVHLLKTENTWIRYNPETFVVTMILVALEENQIIRNCAGKLFDSLNKKRLLSKNAIKLGVNKVLNDSGIKKEYPNLSTLVSDITNELKL